MAGKKVGVVLAGCGVFDGSEIHEAVLTLLALDRAGAEIVFLAPGKAQHHVVDHGSGQEAAGESRSIPAEAARIARGAVRDVAEIAPDELDALIFPGGFGAAKNLCDFALEGAGCTVDPGVERLVLGMLKQGKPQGFICIAPAIAAKVLGHRSIRLTIGTDPETAAALESMGARHQPRQVHEICLDRELKVVSTPAYMLGPSIAQVEKGIASLVSKVLELA